MELQQTVSERGHVSEIRVRSTCLVQQDKVKTCISKGFGQEDATLPAEWLFRYPLWRLPTGLLLFKIWWLMVRRKAMNRVNVHQPLLIMIHGPNLGTSLWPQVWSYSAREWMIHFGGVNHFDPPPYVCIRNLAVVNFLIKIDLGFGATMRLVKSHVTSKLGGHGYRSRLSTLQHPWVSKL